MPNQDIRRVIAPMQVNIESDPELPTAVTVEWISAYYKLGHPFSAYPLVGRLPVELLVKCYGRTLILKEPFLVWARKNRRPPTTARPRKETT